MPISTGLSNSSDGADSHRARLNSLNVQDKSLKKLLEQLNSAGLAEAEDLPADRAVNREFARWEFPADAIALQIDHLGGTTATLRVVCRNLSRGGASVLHAAYVHVGSTCKVILPHNRRGPIAVPGRVVRCEHRGGVVHELGIAFTKPIRVRDFVATDPFSKAFSLERVDPTTLTGTFVHIEPIESFRTHVSEIMRETKMQLLEFTNVESAIDAAKSASVVLLSGDIEGRNPKELVQSLCDAAVACPILVVMTQSQRAISQATGIPAAAFFYRPVSRDLLFKAIAECSLSDAPFPVSKKKKAK